MVAHLSSSLGFFAVIWLAICVLSSAVVTDALLRSDDPGTASRKGGGLRDGTGLQAGE